MFIVVCSSGLFVLVLLLGVIVIVGFIDDVIDLDMFFVRVVGIVSVSVMCSCYWYCYCCC